MEISARVLKEVEFNSSLRGYNTDEVDEFLEQVAAAVERLQAEAKAAAERVEQAELSSRDRTGIEDDDSIRRTLVLAQRTADLAVKEAQQEADEIRSQAREEADTLVSDARDSAQHITSDAERRLREEVSRLAAKRDDLRTEVDTLLSLLSAERERLTETLGAALRYVERSLSPSSPLLSLATKNEDEGHDLAVVDAEPPAEVEELEMGDDGVVEDMASSGPAPDDDADDEMLDDPEDGHGGPAVSLVDEVEAAIAEDAAAAAPSLPARYDWDSVIRGRSDPQFGSQQARTNRPKLTPLPPRDTSLQDTAAWQLRARGRDWPA